MKSMDYFELKRARIGDRVILNNGSCVEVAEVKMSDMAKGGVCDMCAMNEKLKCDLGMCVGERRIDEREVYFKRIR